MEELLKQFMNEMREFRSEVSEKFAQVNQRLDNVEHDLKHVNQRLDNVENRLINVEHRLDNVESRLINVEHQLDNVKTELKEVKEGQIEIKDALKHHTTLMIETLTNMRKDIRTATNDMQADVNLLFREVEAVKRQANKIEQRLTN
jgi:chromosome segregation ATPase